MSDSAHAHDESYLSQYDFEEYLAMEQCDMSPMIQWPQTAPLHDFQMQPHFGSATELGFAQDAGPSGYPVSMPLPDVIDTYPALHGQMAYPGELQSAQPFGLDLLGPEAFSAQVMQPLYEAAPAVAQQPVHVVQHAGPIVSPQPVYPSQVAPAAVPDDYGGRSCMYRMRTAPRLQPLFTNAELDQWAALVRADEQSRSGEQTLEVKQENDMRRSSPTPTATSSRIDGVGPHGEHTISREGVVNPSNAKCVQERNATPGKSLGAVEAPGKTRTTTTSRAQTGGAGRGRGRGGIAKKEKPPKPPPFLACFFCRGRKIACTPPAAGNADRTCNQCERRGLICEYPLVSRRGQRRPKGFNISELGPKVRYVPRRKASVKLEDA